MSATLDRPSASSGAATLPPACCESTLLAVCCRPEAKAACCEDRGGAGACGCQPTARAPRA